MTKLSNTSILTPYGMVMPGKHGSAGGQYRYGFQGQEKDDEVKGQPGNSINYKYRMHDPRVGRFFAVDPLFKKYPHNSPYAFSENMVIHAVELEGKEAYFIHGTTAALWYDWSDQVTSEQMRENNLLRIAKVFDNSTINRDFNWSGTNNDAARTQGALELSEHILSTYDKTGNEPITLIAHSHGGNISIEAANILIEQHGIPAEQINIVAINTPRLDNTELRHSDVDLWVVSAFGDKVQYWGSSDWTDPNITANRDGPLITYFDQIESDSWNHSGWATANVDVWLPGLDEQVHFTLEEPQPSLQENVPNSVIRDNTNLYSPSQTDMYQSPAIPTLEMDDD